MRLHNLGTTILKSEQKRGNDIRPWTFAGYQGLKCGSAQVGTRHDSTCIRLSSGVAAEHWLDAYHAGESFSRVDLQSTFKLDYDPQRLIQSVYRSALAHTKKKKNGPACTILKSSNGTATVYLGRRQSNLFLRCYDKGRESGLDYYQNCVRFEAEVKGPICLLVLRDCASLSSGRGNPAKYVSSLFRRRGCAQLPESDGIDTLCVPRKRSDTERKLTWLSTQIRPSVQSLIRSGHLADVIQVLGLPTVKSARGTVSHVVQLREVGGK
jgi:DNA relaxase NicK